jgi:hypothetical protein
LLCQAARAPGRVRSSLPLKAAIECNYCSGQREGMPDTRTEQFRIWAKSHDDIRRWHGISCLDFFNSWLNSNALPSQQRVEKIDHEYVFSRLEASCAEKDAMTKTIVPDTVIFDTIRKKSILISGT